MRKITALVAMALMAVSCGQGPAVSDSEDINVADLFYRIAETRFSCRQFKPEQISGDKLGFILESGRLAPTAANLQEEHIYVVQSEEALEIIDQQTRCRYGAPTCLVVTYDRNNVFNYPGGQYNSGAEDVSIVATHMMLAAQAAGIASCWVNMFDPYKLREALTIPENEVPVLILDLGYAADDAAPSDKHYTRKPFTDIISYR